MRPTPPASDFAALALRLHGTPHFGATHRAHGEGLVQRSTSARPPSAASRIFDPAGGPGRPNRTGLPDALKETAERAGGFALDDVRVHRGSRWPAQLEARAYAQGRDIHLAAGEERHLPHEVWHVVQQRQGRVPPTTRRAGTAINDDPRLEREADAFAASSRPVGLSSRAAPGARTAVPVAQMYFTHRGETIGSTLIDSLRKSLEDGRFVTRVSQKKLTKIKIEELVEDFDDVQASTKPQKILRWMRTKNIQKSVGPDFKVGKKVSEAQAGRMEASRADITLGGANQKGRYPKSPVHAYEHFRAKEKPVSFENRRSRQILHQISEVMKWKLAQSKNPTMEVQTRYDIDDTGEMSLSMSANKEIKSGAGTPQTYLDNLTKEDLGAILKEAVSDANADARVKRVASKIRSYKKRAARMLEQGEDADDVARMQKVVAKFLIKDFTLVGGDKHAEQNLGDDKAGTTSKEMDVAGSLIRCAACAAALGHDHTLQQQLALAHQICGRFFFSKATADQWEDFFVDLLNDRTRIADKSERPESDSEADLSSDTEAEEDTIASKKRKAGTKKPKSNSKKKKPKLEVEESDEDTGR